MVLDICAAAGCGGASRPPAASAAVNAGPAAGTSPEGAVAPFASLLDQVTAGAQWSDADSEEVTDQDEPALDELCAAVLPNLLALVPTATPVPREEPSGEPSASVPDIDTDSIASRPELGATPLKADTTARATISGAARETEFAAPAISATDANGTLDRSVAGPADAPSVSESKASLPDERVTTADIGPADSVGLRPVLAASTRAEQAAATDGDVTSAPATNGAKSEATGPEATPRLTPAGARFSRAVSRELSSASGQVTANAPVQAPFESSSAFDQGMSSGEHAPDSPRTSASAPQTSGAAVFHVATTPASAATAIAAGHPSDVLPSDAATADIPEREVVAQLVQSLRVQFKDGIGNAVVRLKPEHLGAVSIALRMENGTIAATVQADVAAVRQWLEAQQDSLRSGLAEHGLQLGRFVVEPDGERREPESDPRDERPRRRQLSARGGEEQPVFEILV